MLVREGYDTYQSGLATYDAYQQGNTGTALFNGAMTAISGVGFGFSARGVAGDVIEFGQSVPYRFSRMAGQGQIQFGMGGAGGFFNSVDDLGRMNAGETLILNPDFQKGFSSPSELVKYLGPAGKGRAWHHIVEKNPANIAKFGPERIHNINNIVNLPHGSGTLHNKISGFFSSRAPGGGRIRDWINTKTFEEQYDFGLRTMERLYQP